MKIGITGAEGTIGSVLRKGLSNKYKIISFTLQTQDFESVQMDLSNNNEIKGKFEGLDALIHLAADPRPEASWESVKKNNLEATYNVYNEVKNAGVKKIIFASTNHTQHGDTLLSTPETLDLKKNKILSLENNTNPDSLYAVSKLFGEDLGKYFSEQHKIKFIGLRIGWIVKGDDPTIMCGTPSEDYLRSMYLSHRDCIQAFERALESSRDFLIAYAISNNSTKVFDLKETSRTLNFYPEDDSENYFMNVK
jgi:nucleoside-diphosphate-sugar epimerase